MEKLTLERRNFLKKILAGLPLLALDWEAFPRGALKYSGETPYDAVIIGAGLGGLSCAAALVRQGFKPLVLEQHRIPGGYATTFKRSGGFVFDVSLHSTAVGERNGIVNLIPGFPEITDVKFVPHRTLYRAIYPEHDIRVPHKNIPAYIKILQKEFPDEKEGIAALFKDMQGFNDDLNKYNRAGGRVDMSRFVQDFPYLAKNIGRTWGAMMGDRIKDPKLQAIVSGLWGYFGLPPSKLSSLYYAMPTIGYLQEGGYYPIGRSQAISNALADFIISRGGEIKYRTRVERILIKDHTAYGVRTKDSSEYLAKVVVSNANAFDTFYKMMDEKVYLKKYLDRMATFTASASSFQVWLGLNTDLIRKLGIKDTEVKEIATPLTNVRYTSNYRGAIYGWDQTVANSMPRRLAPKTPIRNLYLSGAWTQPGGGYGACLPSGLMCFGQIMQDWKR
ncbi:MAG: FAD-dependent oxidoreductase [Candidatus Aminicenantes bacterium]|nr:FAD-dependent oxidoreductase [Candidatus Aminicenantes bacterium]